MLSCSSLRGFARVNSGDPWNSVDSNGFVVDIRILFLTHSESINGTLMTTVNIKIGLIYDFVNIILLFFFIICPILEFSNKVYCLSRWGTSSGSRQEETYRELEKGSSASPVITPFLGGGDGSSVTPGENFVRKSVRTFPGAFLEGGVVFCV
jgi:hypothetical protein